MARIISGGVKGMKPVKTSRSQIQQQEALPAPALERLGYAALKPFAGLGSGLAGLIEGIGSLAGLERRQDLPEASFEGLVKSQGYTPEQVRAQNIPEEIAHRFIQSAPLAGVAGGIPGVARAALGSGAGALLGQATGSEGVGDIAQVS